FDAGWHGKAELVEDVFHPVSELYGLDRHKNVVSVMSRQKFFDVLRGPSPESEGVKRFDSILNIDFSGPETALATVRCQHEPYYWTDYLILLKTDQGWRVVSKTYKTEDTFSPAVQHDPSSHDLADITRLLQTYFDAVYTSDATALAKVFHPCSSLRTLDASGNVTNLVRDDWLAAVAKRSPSASEQGLPRADKVLFVQQSNAHTAVAKVNCQLVPRYFTDYLTMIKDAEGWRIVSKVYRTEVKE
ncbi:hypothetical protein HDU93_002275, partial [Gonapodya sp. JEL0774]